MSFEVGLDSLGAGAAGLGEMSFPKCFCRQILSEMLETQPRDQVSGASSRLDHRAHLQASPTKLNIMALRVVVSSAMRLHIPRHRCLDLGAPHFYSLPADRSWSLQQSCQHTMVLPEWLAGNL